MHDKHWTPWTVNALCKRNEKTRKRFSTFYYSRRYNVHVRSIFFSSSFFSFAFFHIFIKHIFVVVIAASTAAAVTAYSTVCSFVRSMNSFRMCEWMDSIAYILCLCVIWMCMRMPACDGDRMKVWMQLHVCAPLCMRMKYVPIFSFVFLGKYERTNQRQQQQLATRRRNISNNTRRFAYTRMVACTVHRHAQLTHA